jgi:hypothetical protein
MDQAHPGIFAYDPEDGGNKGKVRSGNWEGIQNDGNLVAPQIILMRHSWLCHLWEKATDIVGWCIQGQVTYRAIHVFGKWTISGHLGHLAVICPVSRLSVQVNACRNFELGSGTQHSHDAKFSA